MPTAPDSYAPGQRVEIHLNANTFGQEGWFTGVVVRIEPYSAHRSFIWVELEEEARAMVGGGVKLVSVFNLKNIRPAGRA